MTFDNMTIVMPAWNEAAAIGHVIAELRGIAALQTMSVLVVDDGSTDATAAIIRECMQRDSKLDLLGITHAGKDQVLWIGVRMVASDWVAVMDADGQYAAADILQLAEVAHNKRFDAVWGFRRCRQDNPWRCAQSTAAAWIKQAWMTTCVVRDAGCGLFVARRAWLNKGMMMLPAPCGQVHCHLPEILHAMGAAVGECAVQHRPRGGGHAKYTMLNRLLPAWRSLRQARKLVHTLRQDRASSR